jgi:DMSO/TMAO reductase YedYZ molybdopterin-dependent catalytic subunit
VRLPRRDELQVHPVPSLSGGPPTAIRNESETTPDDRNAPSRTRYGLIMAPPEMPRERDPRTLPLGRAAFLGTIAAGIGGIALASRYDRAVTAAVQDVAAAVPVVNQIAPTEGWRIYTVADTMPRFDPAAYRLRVRGLVDHPLDLSWADVAALAGVEQVSDFHCVTGWTVRKVHWEGFRPSTLLALARPKPTARFVSLVSMEKPYVDQLSLKQLQLRDVLFARQMDGKPLQRVHGSPLRLVIPDMYGYKSVKWVNELVVQAADAPGYWEQRGYDTDAWVGRSNGLG